MKVSKIRMIGAMCVAAVWALLSAWAWFGSDNAFSMAERRELAQKPALTWDSVMDGSFMEKFDDYSLDQFPLRDSFRQIKSLTHYYGLMQKDNHDIYIADGYAAKQEYPLRQESVDRAATRFSMVYRLLLKGNTDNIYMAVVPDKGYYLAEDAGQLSMDYDQLMATMETSMPWATHIDLTGSLSAESYYRTDTHWRQEKLTDAAKVICQSMGVTAADASSYTVETLQRPFYGVYYGQAALPMEGDTMYLLHSDVLDSSTTYVGDWDVKTNTPVYQQLYKGVYDRQRLEGEDMYEAYLSGIQSILRIENPNAKTDRELIVFRDSFGSSIVPLLMQDYAVVTVIDIREIDAMTLRAFGINWDADVLFLFSTLVLNNSETIK
jgi:hypothetical protein